MTGRSACGGQAPPLPGLPEVDLWWVEVPRCQGFVSDASCLLTQAESERARRIKHLPSRQRFLAGRVALRSLLGEYLERDPRGISIQMAPAGKPILADGEPGSVTFNLSHAGDWVLLAFGFGASVGVDVEYVTGFRDLEEVAARVLTGGELAELRALPSEARVEPFYRAWTRKEALLKALGTGLTEAASQLPTGVGAPGPWGGSEVMVRPRGSDGEWTVVSLDAPEGYCAAVAKEGAPLKIRSTGTRKIWNS